MRPNFGYIEQRAIEVLIKNDLFTPNFRIKDLAKKLNIKLIAEDLDDDVSGFFVLTDNNLPVITYSTKGGDKRARFTIAHEIGHFLMHSKEQPIFIDKTPKILFRNSASSTGEIFKEKEANAFAAALLMPKDLIERVIINAPDDVEKAIKYLANEFGVSEQAMTFRLSNLGYSI